MLYELRMYRAGPGRVQDVANRMRDRIPAMFRKHGFPVPMAEWVVSAGAHMPMYAWMLSWPNSDVRAKAFASLYGDEEWAKVRTETNGPREMVLKYDIYLMHAGSAWEAAKKLHADRSGPADGLHELRIYEVYPGKQAEANRILAEVDLPALKKAGGVTLGIFDPQAGPELPSLVHIIRWESYEQRMAALRAYEADPSVVAQRKREEDELNTYVLGKYNSWLLTPMDFRTANSGLT